MNGCAHRECDQNERHAFGGLMEEDGKFLEQGSNVGRPTPTDTEYDPITGIPRMGSISVSVTPGWPN